MAKSHYKTLLEWLDEVPPFFVRAIAVETGPGKKARRTPVSLLIARSGIKTRRLKYLSKFLSWENVTVGDVSRFLTACAVDVVKREKLYDRIRMLTTRSRRGPMPHLTKEQRETFDRLALEWNKKQGK